MTAVRFLNNNLAAADAATVAASSAAAGFPAANAVDERRWKRWRTSGAFTVTTANRSLYVADGSNKTATIATGTYATASALCTAIATALNAVSTNWTATYSSTTGKFTLGRSSGTATLRLTQTANAAWSMLGYVGAADTSAGTGLAADVRRNHTSETWTVDLGMDRQVTAFVMLAASGEVFPISESATLRLRASNVNTATTPWTTYDAEYAVTRTDDLAMAYLDGTYRYWQVEWIDQTNPAGPGTEIAQIYLGDYVTPTADGLDLVVGFERVLVDPSERQESEAGVLFHREKSKYWLYRGLSLDYVEGADRVALERMLNELGRTVPFFIALDPGAAISADIAEFTKYVVLEEDPTRPHRFFNKYGLSFNVREVVG